ncbi:MAG: hypothetical protein WC856_02215 [Methylococcaceae bacterium]
MSDWNRSFEFIHNGEEVVNSPEKVIYHYCAMYQVNPSQDLYIDGLFSFDNGIKSDAGMRVLREHAAKGTLCEETHKITILSLTRISG